MESKVDVNIDFSLYVYNGKTLTDVDKKMITNTIKNCIRNDLCPKLTSQYNDSQSLNTSFVVADDDYIDVILKINE